MSKGIRKNMTIISARNTLNALCTSSAHCQSVKLHFKVLRMHEKDLQMQRCYLLYLKIPILEHECRRISLPDLLGTSLKWAFIWPSNKMWEHILKKRSLKFYNCRLCTKLVKIKERDSKFGTIYKKPLLVAWPYPDSSFTFLFPDSVKNKRKTKYWEFC